MDLIDKQNVIRFQIGQNCCQVTRPFEHGPGSLPEVDGHFIGDDMCQRCFAKARRSEDQYMVQCFGSVSGRRNEDVHLLLDRRLADEVA